MYDTDLSDMWSLHYVPYLAYVSRFLKKSVHISYLYYYYPFPLAYLLFSYPYLLYSFELDSENPLELNLLSHF